MISKATSLMFTLLLIAALLVVATVTIHAVGFDALMRMLVRSRALNAVGFLPVTRLVIGLACWLVLIHLTEIGFWGLFYFWRGCLPDLKSALYFSAGTYSTIGSGELVLPRAWRILAPLEALTANLMCGLSTGLFFALVSRWISNWMHWRTASESHAAAPTNK